MIVRRERPRDHAAVRAVHAAAFRPPGGGDAPEAGLVDELREDAGSSRTWPWSLSTGMRSSVT